MARIDAAPRLARRDWAVFLIAFIVVVLDQISKYLVRTHITPGESVPLGSLVKITHLTNTGAAFSLLPDKTVLFIIVAIVAIAIIVFYSRQLPRDRVMVRAGLGLQLGGAIGNLIDRLFHGQVTDFIDVSIWPVFNVADSAIIVGVCVLAYFLLIQAPQQPESVRTEGGEPQHG